MRVATSPATDRAALARGVLAAFAIAQLALLCLIVANHWRFPLFLETMEGTILQQVRRAAQWRHVFPEPAPDYVPLAYNPLLYYVSAPFAALFGASLAGVRLVAIAGLALTVWLVHAIVRDETGKPWLALVAAGLFAAAYKVMDAYLDTAHADSWLVASILLGSRLLAHGGSMRRDAAGIAILCAAFWFKQPGALFAASGLAFVIWRRGLRASWPAVAVALVAGPLLYVVAGPALFGSHFHYFTWQVPSSWSTLSLRALAGYAWFLIATYPVLLAVASLWLADQLWRAPAALSIWQAQLVTAIAAGALATLSPGSAANVFAPAGALLIIAGTIALAQALPDFDNPRRQSQGALAAAALALSFVPLLYDPRPLLVDRAGAEAAYRDLASLIGELGGPTASPSLGQLPSGPRLAPAGSWVALDDMIRGRRVPKRSPALFDAALAPALLPAPRFLLMNEPLADNAVFEALRPRYRLARDLGDRFRALAGLPGAYPVRSSWPRYVYERVRDGG